MDAPQRFSVDPALSSAVTRHVFQTMGGGHLCTRVTERAKTSRETAALTGAVGQRRSMRSVHVQAQPGCFYVQGPHCGGRCEVNGHSCSSDICLFRQETEKGRHWENSHVFFGELPQSCSRGGKTAASLSIFVFGLFPLRPIICLSLWCDRSFWHTGDTVEEWVIFIL